MAPNVESRGAVAWGFGSVTVPGVAEDFTGLVGGVVVGSIYLNLVLRGLNVPLDGRPERSMDRPAR